MVGCTTTVASGSAHQAACDVPLEVNSTASFLSSATPNAEGILIFRGISYRIRISNWSSGSETYHATGTACGLDKPMDIAGRYRIDAKADVWRNENGVEIHIHPPLPSPPKSGELEVKLAGALLPRQP
jgi:hypothetical protein